MWVYDYPGSQNNSDCMEFAIKMGNIEDFWTVHLLIFCVPATDPNPV